MKNNRNRDVYFDGEAFMDILKRNQLSILQAAREIDISETTLRNAIKQNQITPLISSLIQPFLDKYAKIPVREEDNPQEEWYKQAENISFEELPKFLNHMLNHYAHDYGTVCHAIVASLSAVAHAMAREQGITGFQAGQVMWLFIRQWMYNDNKVGLKIIDYDKMLYPQYHNQFEKKLDKHVWESLQKEAERLLKEKPNAAEEVKKHWREISHGMIPFGYSIKEE